MTSSLVGSEMCIRDSTMPEYYIAVLNPDTDTESEIEADIIADDEYRKMPVSYTHLTLPTICSV
eukprot:11027629-Prorocentrum_lima.AAC.1